MSGKRGGITFKSGLHLTAAQANGTKKAAVAARRFLTPSEERALALPPLVHTSRRGMK
jgi:hypothetical protein